MVPDGRSPAAMKARYVPLETTNTEVGWGIVHLYREGEEAPGLGLPSAVPQQRRGQDQSGEVADAVDGAASVGAAPDASEDKNCTILCIPAVPSYLSPSDFLGFVGERWRDDVSHYRMVMTSRLSRYLVLLKFRDPQRAAEWRREFDGRVFNSMEAQVCQVVFVRSITFETPGGDVGGGGGDGANFPDLSHDPFTPSTSTLPASGASTTTLTLRPFPPPTPSLVELPTCPVCLERMDETTGLMTIPCQHVFHCSCLQKWKGQGCPVCRHTNPSILDTYMSTTSGGASATAGQTPGHHDASANPLDRPFGGPAVSNLCSVCDCPTDLWICLICGNVGCGRYKGGHAKSHWKETAHSFALELETQHVWDYAGDMWVHRLIRDKGDGKVVELPGINKAQPSNTAGRGASGTTSGGHHDDDMDVVPRAKLERIGLEYTHLLTSQLESQRVYFEEMVAKAADKAAAAAANAEKASIRADDALAELRALQAEHAVLRDETVPQLERDLARERARAAKAQDLARELTKSLQEERKLSEGLVARVTHVNARLEEADKRNEELRREIEDLKETNRDLTMFISGQEKLRELEREGKVDQEDVEAGTASVPEDKRRRGKGKGKR